MIRIALKIDVDTYRGTLEGAPRLAQLLERSNIPATFLFSLGPDHTGRALKRVFRRGFLGKVRRTSVLEHYGLKTLLYGTVLPGPHIGRRCGEAMRQIAGRGFEVGMHTYDHVRWQDNVATQSAEWARREMQLGVDSFREVFGQPPSAHGAAGWQTNAAVPRLEQELGFRYASDTRGSEPFIPVVEGICIPVPQLPTTLPTLDELIGREDLPCADPIEHLLQLTSTPARDHVFTLHAEIEGGRYLEAFERLLRTWQRRGVQLENLASASSRLDLASLPRCSIASGRIAGRSGTLACQGPAATAA